MRDNNRCKLSSNIMRLLGVSLGHFANDFYVNLIPPILFIFASDMSLTLTQQGFLAFVITGSSSFAQPLVGHLCDRKGRPQFLVYSLIWITLWMSITGIISSYYLLALVLAIGSLASALYHPLGSAVTIRLIKSAQGSSLSFFMAVGDFAASLAPLVAVPLVNYYGLSSLLYLVFPGLLVALFMHYTRLDKIEFGPERKIDSQPGQGKVSLDRQKSGWLAILLYSSSMRYWLTRVFMVFGIQFLLLKETNLTTAGIVLSLYLFTKTLGTFLGGFIADIMGTKNLLLTSFLLATISQGAMVFTTRLWAIILFIFTSFIISVSSTANIIIAHDIVPDNATFATGLIMGFAGGIGGLGILLVGKLADSFGLVNAMAYLLVPLAVAIFLIYFLPETASCKGTLPAKEQLGA